MNNRITFPRSSRFLDPWVKPLNPTLRIASYGEMEIDVDKSADGMGDSASRDFDLEDCPQIQQMTSATLAFYNRVEAKPMRDLSNSTMPVAMQGPVSDHSVIWLEGIILKFKLSSGYIRFPGPSGEFPSDVYYWEPQSSPTPQIEVSRFFAGVCTRGQVFRFETGFIASFLGRWDCLPCWSSKHRC